MSGPEVKPLHSEKVIRVFFSIHKLAILTHFQWVMESHLLTCSFTQPSYHQEPTFFDNFPRINLQRSAHLPFKTSLLGLAKAIIMNASTWAYSSCWMLCWLVCSRASNWAQATCTPDIWSFLIWMPIHTGPAFWFCFPTHSQFLALYLKLAFRLSPTGLAVPLAHIVLENVIENPSFTLQP